MRHDRGELGLRTTGEPLNMRVLHISYFYGFRCGGASVAAARLHNRLLDAGVESHFLCAVKREDGRNVIEWPPRGTWVRGVRLLLAKAARNVWRFSRYRRKIDLNVVPLNLARVVRNLKPDIVHVHGIGADTVRFEELAALKVPVVVMTHDFWMVNGFDPHPLSDTRIFRGFTRDNSGRLERWLWNRKVALSRSPFVSYVAPSAWAADVVRRSVCGQGKWVEVMRCFIGSEFRFRPEKRRPHPKFRILFGADSALSNRFKGFQDLKSALALLPSEIQRKTELLVFGDTGGDFDIGDIRVRLLGFRDGAQALVDTYHGGDVFAFPSTAETQGMVKLEAMLCGLPVVAFDRTACAESVVPRQTGWVAKDGDLKGFADGLRFYFEEWKSGRLEALRQAIHDRVAAEYGDDRVLERALAVYAEAVRRTRSISVS